MNEKIDFKNYQLSNFQLFENRLNGEKNLPVHSLRKEAICKFSELAMPTTKDEEWKYTNVSPILNFNFKLASDIKVDVKKEDIKSHFYNEKRFYTVVFVNGVFSKNLSNLKGLNDKLVITDLTSALKNNPELILKYLGKYAGYTKNIFTALSTAYINEGTFIQVKDNSVIDKPIQILYVTSTNEEVIFNPRNLFIIGKNSNVKILENYFSLTGAVYFTNAVTEIAVDENAVVEHIKIQNENLNAFHISTTQINLERTSKFSSFNIDFGGSLVRNDVNLLFNDVTGECNLNGLYLAQGIQHIDNHTLIDHAKPQCLSNESYKGILSGKSHGVFNGKILVRRDAQKTNAFQQNKNLLLSKDALIDTKPQLEIFADDVKCSHGATVGQLDKDALFYLKSRGIGEEEAKVILIYAFASDVVRSIGIKEVRERLEKLLAEKLL
jgi:Fe-S cluster assembly protein SufD